MVDPTTGEITGDVQQLLGPKVCIMGLGGTGKTYSLGTLADWCDRNKFELAILFTEQGLESFLGYFRDQDREPPACVYWHQQRTKPISLKNLRLAAENVGKLSYEALAKSVDTNRSGENNAFWKILGSCSDFTDDRTGKKLGGLEEFPPQPHLRNGLTDRDRERCDEDADRQPPDGQSRRLRRGTE